MQAYGAGATVGLLLPYSRLHESEADRIISVVGNRDIHENQLSATAKTIPTDFSSRKKEVKPSTIS